MGIHDFILRSLICAAVLTPQDQPQPPAAPPAQLVPTVHPAIPTNPSDLWLVPSETDRAPRALAGFEPLTTGVKRFQDGNYAAALTFLTNPALAKTGLADYAAYYKGLAQLRLGQVAEARRTFDAVIDRKAPGYVSIAAGLASGEAAELSGDYKAAITVYERIADQKAAVNDELLSRLGRAALAAGDRAKAAQAFLRVYYEFPLTDAANGAAFSLRRCRIKLRARTTREISRARRRCLARGDSTMRAPRLLRSRSSAEGDDQELASLRIAECDFYLKRYAAARDGVQPYLDGASRKAEARFFYLSSLRELGDRRSLYVSLTGARLASFPTAPGPKRPSTISAPTTSSRTKTNSRRRRSRSFTTSFPTGPRAERAAWKYGWYGYMAGDYAETVRVFESAAVGFPRSDYRPSFLYWAGRAHERLGDSTQADSRMRLVYTDYANSYYGRLAERQLARSGDVRRTRGDVRRVSSRADAAARSQADSDPSR